MVKYTHNNNLINGIKDATPNFPTANAMPPKAPSGAIYITKVNALKTYFDNDSKELTMVTLYFKLLITIPTHNAIIKTCNVMFEVKKSTQLNACVC